MRMERELEERYFKALLKLSSFPLLPSSKRPRTEPSQPSAGVICLDTQALSWRDKVRQGKADCVSGHELVSLSWEPGIRPLLQLYPQVNSWGPSALHLCLPVPGLSLTHRNLIDQECETRYPLWLIRLGVGPWSDSYVFFTGDAVWWLRSEMLSLLLRAGRKGF